MPAQAPPPEPPFAPGALPAAILARLDRWIRHGEVAGLQYLVMRAGSAPLEHCAGMADAGQGQRVVPDTVFNLYSLTKPLTATLVTRLALQGALHLDQPIATATGLPALGHLGTLRETLTHRAGFSNPWPLRWTHRASEDTHFNEADFVDRRLAEAATLRRQSPRYSNIGYLALGRAIECVTGVGFRQALQRGLLAELQLGEQARLGFAPRPHQPWALGHLRRFSLLNAGLGLLVPRHDVVAGRSGGWVRLQAHQVNGSAYGGLIGNARGLARFGAATLGLVPGIEASVRHLVCADDPASAQSRTLGWRTGRLLGRPWLGHAGGGLGAYAELRLYPEQESLSVLLTNRPGLRDAGVLDVLDRHWLDAAP